MGWTQENIDKLLDLLGGIRAILATCCEHLEQALPLPPKSSRPSSGKTKAAQR